MARIKTTANYGLLFQTYFVLIDVQFLIGMDVVHEFELCIDFRLDLLTSKQKHWKVPNEFKHGHGYIQHYQQMFY